MDCPGHIVDTDGRMFAKVYHQIFDSSIAEDHQVRHTFMDLLVLADMDGVVDMTLEAIARRTNVPIEQVTRCVGELTKPDPKSRSSEEHGVRLKLIDSHRDWGWQIINYAHYRELRDEESRRAYFRDHKRKQRAKAKGHVQNVQSCPKKSNSVTHAEAEAEAEAEESTLKKKIPPSLDEVKLLMAKSGLPESEAQSFMDFYNSNGWKVGRNKMVSVGGAVGSWASRYRQRLALSAQPSPTALLIVHQKELDRVTDKMRAIKASYSEHQAWTQGDKDAFLKLRERKTELQKLLGVHV